MNIMRVLLFIVVISSSGLCASDAINKPFATLFCPGILSSELQTTKYCPVYAIRKLLSVDEHVASIHTFHNNTIFDGTSVWACNFDEMVSFDTYRAISSFSINKAFSTCVQQATKRVNSMFGPYRLIINDSSAFDAQGGSNTYLNFYLDWSKLNFGQESDIACIKDKHHQAHKDLMTSKKKCDLIGFGFSRGAAALFNYVALNYDHTLPLKALVFEACPMNIAAFMSSANLLFLEKTTSFRKNGLCPESLTQQFAQVCKQYTIPLLFICSKKDEIVPYQQTLTMCLALKQQGVKNIHLIVLNDSMHNAYLFDNASDRDTYHKAIHQFFKKYDLDYQQHWASQENSELIQIS